MSDRWLDKVVRDYFKALLAIVLLAGVCLLLLSHVFCPATLWHDFFRDLGIAAIISFIVTIVIEDYSARRREADIQSGVLDAILKKIVHPEVWEEIKSDILEPALCKDWHLQISVCKARVLVAPGEVEEHYVAEGALTYRLTNQTNREQSVVLKHELESDLSGTEADTSKPLPRFVQLDVLAVGKATTYTEEELTKFLTGLNLEVPFSIPPSGTIEVGLRRREIMNVPGARIWYMNWVTLSPAITIQTELNDVSFDVLARHPNGSRLQKVIPGKAWLFPGVLFPGQGLELVRTKIAAVSPPRKPVAD